MGDTSASSVLSPGENRRRQRGFLLAAVAPVVAAMSSVGVLMTLAVLDVSPGAREIAMLGVISAHCAVAAAASFASVLLLHPVPAGRLVKAVLWAVASIPIFVCVLWPLLGFSMVIYLTVTGKSLGPGD